MDHNASIAVVNYCFADDATSVVVGPKSAMPRASRQHPPHDVHRSHHNYCRYVVVGADNDDILPIHNWTRHSRQVLPFVNVSSAIPSGRQYHCQCHHHCQCRYFHSLDVQQSSSSSDGMSMPRESRREVIQIETRCRCCIRRSCHCHCRRH